MAEATDYPSDKYDLVLGLDTMNKSQGVYILCLCEKWMSINKSIPLGSYILLRLDFYGKEGIVGDPKDLAVHAARSIANNLGYNLNIIV